MEKVSLGRHELELLATELVSFSGLDVSRFSMVFLAQTIQMNVSRVVNVCRVMDEIRYLEGVGFRTNTKKASMFNNEPLRGLMKTHFTDSTFLVKNIGIHMGLGNGGGKKLDKLIQDAFEKNTSGLVDDEFASYIVHGLTVGVLEERSAKQKMTGEWIVFREFCGSNYYLTLAAHNEGDENIYSRVLDSYKMDFPFLLALDQLPCSEK